MKLIDRQMLIGGLLHLVQQGRDWAEPQPARRPTPLVCCSTVLMCRLNG